MTASEIRTKYLQFFRDRDHVIIPRANLVPQEDPTTLFTGSGMQPLIPYLLGQPHPAGKRVVDSQTCFRAEDIDEVGDNRHTTFFEMLGNWSFGDYFKAEQLPWIWEFLTVVVGLDPTKLYVTVFAGHEAYKIPKDSESVGIWKKLFQAEGLEALDVDHAASKGMQNGRIFYYDATKNWWSRSGAPENMPVGEPGGPDSEIFYDFGTPHNAAFGEHCHPNCDCGRFLEIGNSVFMQYQKIDGGVEELPQKNVDFGGGLERIAMAANNDDDIFKIDLLWPLVQKVQALADREYSDEPSAMRAIADHIRGIVFLAADGVIPSNTAQGYVMRRFARRAIRQALTLDIRDGLFETVGPVVIDVYKEAYPELDERRDMILDTLTREEELFRRTLERGVREFVKLKDRATKTGQPLTGEQVFMLFDTYGFPSELTIEEAKLTEIPVEPGWQLEFDRHMTEQKERSRTASAGQFKGGLADHSEITTKYHTATHLMYKALRQVLGDHVIQRGSNITDERLRFDFSHHEKMTSEQIGEVERIVNEAIDKDWPMGYREIPTDQAFKEGALGAFGDKYGETVKVYTAGDPEGEWYSKEICGGPHVEHTGTLAEEGKRFKIKKEESSSAGVRRIKAVLE
ncbi:MAG TPA: alanine--tRNA ligase [Candidatus Nanoarchaeia archaeon]|nr:alanine--tRNA ligase [Candidatus Nanoarchaeia archaeon]